MKWARTMAKFILILWAIEWIFFAFGWLISGGGKTDILITAAMLVLILGFLYLARRRPLIAGIFLVLIGALWTVAYLYSDGPSHVLLMNGLPSLFSGSLFLMGRPRRHNV